MAALIDKIINPLTPMDLCLHYYYYYNFNVNESGSSPLMGPPTNIAKHKHKRQQNPTCVPPCPVLSCSAGRKGSGKSTAQQDSYCTVLPARNMYTFLIKKFQQLGDHLPSRMYADNSIKTIALYQCTLQLHLSTAL